jgi:hypothetical protein
VTAACRTARFCAFASSRAARCLVVRADRHSGGDQLAHPGRLRGAGFGLARTPRDRTKATVAQPHFEASPGVAGAREALSAQYRQGEGTIAEDGAAAGIGGCSRGRAPRAARFWSKDAS